MTTEAPTAPTDTPAPAAPTTPPASTPAPAEPPAFSADLPEGWHTQLGDEFSGHAETLKRFGNVGDLAKSYIHARQMRPQFPGPDAEPQDIAAWREIAGVPETPDGYEITKPEDFPAELEWSDDRVGKFKELAHKWNVHPGFLQEAMAMDTTLQAEAVTRAKDAMAQQQAEARDALIAEWGPKFDENASKVRHLAGRLAESAGVDSEAAQSLANNPSFAKLMLRVNGMLSEDASAGRSSIADVRGPQQRANDIMTGKDAEWGEKYQHGDAQAMAVVTKLLQEAEAQ